MAENDNKKEFNEENAKNDTSAEEQEKATQQQDIPDINVDDAVKGTTHLNDKLADEGELEKISNDLLQMKDKYLRLVAEFDNFRKRNAKERVELMQTANKEVIISLLDVLDDCDRAREQLDKAKDIDAVKDGVLLVFNKLRSTLQSLGLKEMESKSEEFDSDLHEAIAEVPAPSKDLQGKIIEDVQKGYYLNDKIIRHAKVVVGK